MADLQATYLDVLSNSANQSGRILENAAQAKGLEAVNKAAVIGSTLGDVANITDKYTQQRLVEQAAKQKKAKQDAEDLAVATAFKDNNGDPDKSIAQLMTTHPERAAKLGQELATTRKTTAESVKLEADAHKAQNDEVLAGALAIPDDDDASYQAFRASALVKHPDMAAVLPPVRTPQTRDTLMQARASADAQLRYRREAMDDFQKGSWQEGIAKLAASANDDDDYQRALKLGRLYAPASIVDAFPQTFSPEAHAFAVNASMSEKDKQELADKAALRKAEQTRIDETHRHNLETEAAAAARAKAAASGGAADDKVAKREAEAWRANQLTALDARQNSNQYTPLKPDELDAARHKIEDLYRQRLGLPPQPPFVPGKVAVGGVDVPLPAETPGATTVTAPSDGVPQVGDRVGQEDYPNGNGPAAPMPKSSVPPEAVEAFKHDKPGHYIWSTPDGNGFVIEKTEDGTVRVAAPPPIPPKVAALLASQPAGSNVKLTDGRLFKKFKNGLVVEVDTDGK